MTDTKTGPIEVWLTQRNMRVQCRVVHEDERTEEGVEIESLSMRGAQREITGYYIGDGYKPDGRWSAEIENQIDGSGETWRRFRPDPDRAT